MSFKSKKIIKNVFLYLIFLFALIGFIFTTIFFGIQFGLLNVKGAVSQRDAYFNLENEEKKENIFPKNTLGWAKTSEWNLMKEVFTRDQEIIKKAGRDAKISPRLIICGVMGEQFRFFTSRRESFKGYFEPLKILASLSKISFGIAGIKPNTAKLMEEHLKDKNSPFYLGEDMENVLDYDLNKVADFDTERMNRITETKNPYYPYLYVGLYMKQVEAQWAKAGYPITGRPEILATLYNLGFPRSIPKENPMAGGAVINIGGKDYTFGDIAYEFYYSEELIDVFPR